MNMTSGYTAKEYESKERWSEAGYSKIFNISRDRLIPIVDVRMRAKNLSWINSTYSETQDELLYSGPTMFTTDLKDTNKKVYKADLVSAYPAYLINSEIKKPGIYRVRYDEALPLTDDIHLYVIRFECNHDNDFVKWFLNTSAVHRKKIKTNGDVIYGEISIFSSQWMNLLKYVFEFFKDTKSWANIVRTYKFLGESNIEINTEAIKELFEAKQYGDSNAKKQLNQSTGWLSRIDRASYYHMVQYVKYQLLNTVEEMELNSKLVGVQTDCIYWIQTDKHDYTGEILADKEIGYSYTNKWGEEFRLGNYTINVVDYSELNKRNVRTLDEKETRGIKEKHKTLQSSYK